MSGCSGAGVVPQVVVVRPAEGESPKGKDIWHLLSEDEKRELVDAVHSEFPDDED